MSAIRTAFCAAVASLSLAACSSMDRMDPSQRNAAIGEALGAVAGAADLSGALTGGKQLAARSELIHDPNDRRRHYVDRPVGRTYWENGDLRG